MADSPVAPDSPQQPGLNRYQNAFNQRQKKNDLYSITKIKLAAHNVAQRSHNSQQEKSQSPHQSQTNFSPPNLANPAHHHYYQQQQLQNGALPSPPPNYHPIPGHGNYDTVPSDDEDAADTDSNHSLPLEDHQQAQLPVNKILSSEKKSPLIVKKDFIPLNLNLSSPSSLNTTKNTDDKKSAEDTTEEQTKPTPSDKSRPILHAELIREIRNGRDTPEANNLLVQLICSQKELKIANWGDVLRAIQSNPEDVKKPHGWDAELPLHWAISEKAPLFIIESLLDIYPEGAKSKGRYGALPLWYALESLGREETDLIRLVQLLLNLHPQGTQRRLDYKLPIMKADQLNLPPAVIQMLLDCDLPYTDSGSPVTYHAHSWAWIIQQTGKKYLPVIENILTLHEDIIPLLTKSCDMKGIPLLATADPAVRQLLMKRAFYCGRYELLMDSLGGGCGLPPVHFSNNSIVITAIDYDAELSYHHAFDTHCTKVNHNQTTLNSPDSDASLTSPINAPTTEGEVIDSVGQLMSALHRLGSYFEPHRINFPEIFSSCEAESGIHLNENQQKVSISRDEFLKYCRELFGYKRKIMIKFMKHEKLYQKEVTYRQSCNLDSRYVIPLIDDELHDLQKDAANLIRENFSRTQFTSTSLPLHFYPYLLIMPVGWNTLQHVYHHITLNPTQIASIIRDVAQALQHIHSRGICHSHLKLSSVIRVGERYCLSDLTAATNLEIFYIQDADIIGSICSTGYLPPEMFIPVNYHNELQITNYWKVSERYHDIKHQMLPHQSGDKAFCVRGYDLDLRTLLPRDLHLLPYRPVLASAQIDMWSLGLILYALSSGETLLPLDSKDNLVYSEDFCQSASWTKESLLERLDEMISDPLAADLCSILLQPHSKDRPHSMKQILDHVYFSGLNNKRNSYIEQKIETIYAESAKRKLQSGPTTQKKRRSGQKERNSGVSLPSRSTTPRPEQDYKERDRARDPGRSSGTSSSTVYSQQSTQKRKSNPLREFTSRFSPIPTRTNTPDSSLQIRSTTPSGPTNDDGRVVVSRISSDRSRLDNSFSDGIMTHIAAIHRILRGGLFHGMELNIPTCFVITNQVLDPNHISYKTYLKYQNSEEEKDDDRYSPVGDMIPEASGSDFTQTFLLPRVQAATRWYNYYTMIHNSLSCDRGVEMISTAVQSMIDEPELYFYLVDELTMLPIMSPLLVSAAASTSTRYPIRIRNPAEVIPKILPLLKNSYMAIASKNNLHLFATAFGFPPSHAPPDLRTLLAAESVADLDSSLELPKLLQSAGLMKKQTSTLSGNGGKSETDSPSHSPGKSINSPWTRRLSYKMFGEDVDEIRGFEGHPLQELAKFFCEHDTDSSYCNLKKISLHDGSQVWTTKEGLSNYHQRQELDIAGEQKGEVDIHIQLSPSPQRRLSGTSLAEGVDDGAGAMVGRTKSGRLITTAELNHNILLVQKELVKLTLAVESQQTQVSSSAKEGPDSATLASCGCILS